MKSKLVRSAPWFVLLCGLNLGASNAESEYSWTSVAAREAAGGLAVTGRVIPQDGALSIESARVAGRVTNILRREGERVEVGTPLFEISSSECFSLLDEKRVAESKNLADFKDGVRRREKQLNLSFLGDRCRIVSTSAGILAKRNVESGAAFNLGDALATVLDTRHLGVELDIPERNLMRIHTDQAVQMQLASDPGHLIHTAIQQILPTIDTTSRTGKVRLKAVALPAGVTLDALVFAEIATAAKERLLQVPSSALVFDHGRQYVVKKRDGKPIGIQISVISESDKLSSVRPIKEDELREGDQVVGHAAIFAFRRLSGQAAP